MAQKKQVADKPKVVTTWFVKPEDAPTNETLMNELLPVCGGTLDKIHRGVLDAHGQRHDLIEVPYQAVSLLQDNRAKMALKFKIYLRREGEPFIHEWKLNQAKTTICRTRMSLELRKQLDRLEEAKKLKASAKTT